MAKLSARDLRARLFAGVALAAVLANGASGQVSTEYHYDALGRLTGAANSDGKTVGYIYDAAGNRVQVTNSIPFDELIPVAFLTSDPNPADGLNTPKGMRDGSFNLPSTAHGSAGEAGSFTTADLGASKLVDHIELAPTTASPFSVSNTNGLQVQWSTDNATWTTVATTSGAVANQYMTIPMGGVTARYVRLFQPDSATQAVGDFRLFGRNTNGDAPPIATSFGVTLPPSGGIIDLAGHISDADHDPLTIASFNNPTAAHNGTVAQASNTSFSYTPNAGVTGDTFSYKIGDGRGGFATGLITVTIAAPANHPPVANPESIGTPPNVAITISPLTNDTDPDGDPLTITGVTGSRLGFTSFTNNTITYTPIFGERGSDSLTYTISDGRGGTASATDPITIAFGLGPDHAPTVVNDNTTITKNTTLSGFTVLANDTDVDGDDLTVSSVSAPIQGGTVTIDANHKTITFVPKPNFTGIDTFTYTVSDGRDFTAVPGTVNVVVQAPANQPPTAHDDFADGTNMSFVTIHVLDNDTDPEGQALSIVGTTQGANGSVTHDGTTVTYVPSRFTLGTDTFQYTIQDIFGAQSTATVHVTFRNQPPTAFEIDLPVANGGSVTINAPQNDPDGQQVTFVGFGSPSRGSVSIAPNGLSATYTSTAGLAGGTDIFSYTVTDTLGATSTAQVHISVSPPTALNASINTTQWNGFKSTLNINDNHFDPPVTVTVSGGSGSYTYNWVEIDGDPAVSATSNSASTQFSTTSEQENVTISHFKCIVTDTVTGLTGETQPITVIWDVESGLE